MKTISLIFMTAGFAFVGCNNVLDTESEGNTEIKAEIPLSEQPERIVFPSVDGIEIVANLYEIDKTSPVIVLCHQARFNKFEYEGIAQKLNKRGFNCIAIDQRSGGPIANQINETALNAEAKNKPTDFLDAEQDIVSAVNYASKRYNQPVILWGSSYSSTLALYVAIENDNVGAVISFSPGNYFSSEKGSLIERLNNFDKPLFITSSKQEAPEIKALISKMTLQKIKSTLNRKEKVTMAQGRFGTINPAVKNTGRRSINF